MTTPNRRDFLQTSVAAFVATLTPWKITDAHNKHNPVSKSILQHGEPVGWDDVHDIAKSCIIGLADGAKVGCLVQQCKFQYSEDYPCEIQIGRLMGPYDMVHGLLDVLGDITQKQNVFFATSLTPGDKGWLFERAVLTQIGMVASTGPSRFDDVCEEGAKSVPVPDKDRLTICENLTLQCSALPSRSVLSRDEACVLLAGASCYDKRQADQNKQISNMSQAEIRAYRQQVRAQADENKDLSAWSAQGVDLKDSSTYPALRPVFRHG